MKIPEITIQQLLEAGVHLGHKTLRWKPKMSFTKGIENTFDWYSKNKTFYSLLKKKDIIKRIGLKKW